MHSYHQKTELITHLKCSLKWCCKESWSLGLRVLISNLISFSLQRWLILKVQKWSHCCCHIKLKWPALTYRLATTFSAQPALLKQRGAEVDWPPQPKTRVPNHSNSHATTYNMFTLLGKYFRVTGKLTNMFSGRQKEEELSDNCRTINNLSLGDVPVGKPRRLPNKHGKANAPLSLCSQIQKGTI